MTNRDSRESRRRAADQGIRDAFHAGAARRLPNHMIIHHRGRPYIDLEHSLPSRVTAISPFVDKLMVLIRKCRCVPEGETDVEIALREALANAVIHGNREDPRKRVHVSCRCKPDEISIVIRDEGQGFDTNNVPDPTASENIGAVHGRGICIMKALMDEVRFEEGGTVIRIQKSAI